MKLKYLILICAMAFLTNSGFSQKVNYKSGLIQVDDKDVAKVVRIKDKESFGLTSSFELFNLKGEKLIIAVLATNFVPNRNDNFSYYYQFSFLPLDKVGIFSLNKLGAEKSFAKLIGESRIVVDDQLDTKKVAEFLARKSQNPEVAIEYHLVKRDRVGAPYITEYKILQANVQIGQFKDVSIRQDLDTYEFSLPEGLVIATVSFTGGNDAQNCNMSTNKDKQSRAVAIPNDGHHGPLLVRSEGVDRNAIVLKKLAAWLVNNQYL